MVASIEQQLIRIEQASPALARDLRLLRQDLVCDIPGALNKARYLAERVLFDICKVNNVDWGKGEATIGTLTDAVKRGWVVPADVHIHLKTLQANANPGSHFVELRLSSAHVHITVAALIAFLEWHLGLAVEEQLSDPVWEPDDPRARPHAHVGEVFAGRDLEVAALSEAVLGEPPRPCVVEGMAGAGKSYLVDRVAHLHRDAFPGGYLRVAVEPDVTRPSEQLRDRIIDLLGIEAGRAPARALRDRLASARTLLHLESVDGAAQARAAVDLVGRLSGCAVVLSGRFAGIGSSARGWQVVRLGPMDAADAIAQLRLETQGVALDDSSADELVQRVGALPLAIHLVAGHLRTSGRAERVLANLDRTQLRLEPYDPADPLLVSDPRRAVLRETIALSIEALEDEWARRGEDPARFRAALAALAHAPGLELGDALGRALSGLDPAELHVLTSTAFQLSCLVAAPQGRWRFHPLIAEVLRREVSTEVIGARIGAWIRERLTTTNEPLRQELVEEPLAIAGWLTAVADHELGWLVQRGAAWAEQRGPYLAWAAMFRRAVASTDAGTAVRARLALARQLIRASALEEATDVATELRDISARADDRAHVGLAELCLAEVAYRQARYRVASEAFDRALREPLGSDSLRAYLGIAELEVERGDHRASHAVIDRHVLPALADLPARAAADARLRLATLSLRRGEAGDGLALASVLAAEGHVAGDLAAEMEARLVIAAGMRQRGELDQVRTQLDQVLALSDALGDPRARARATELHAELMLSRGELVRLAAFVDGPLTSAWGRAGDPMGHFRARRLVGDGLALAGDHRRALAVYREEVLPGLRVLEAKREVAETLTRIAEVLVTAGDAIAARRIYLEEVQPAFDALGLDQGRVRVQLGLAQVAQALGNYDESLRVLREEVLPACERLGDPHRRALAIGAIAEVCFLRGDHAEALRLHRDEELPIYERVGDRRSWIVTRGQIADALEAGGDKVAAREIREGEELPFYREVGDVRSEALCLAKLASDRASAGLFHEAFTLLEGRALPVLDALGDRRAYVVVGVSTVFLLEEAGEQRRASDLARDLRGHLATVALVLPPAMRRALDALASREFSSPPAPT